MTPSVAGQCLEKSLELRSFAQNHPILNVLIVFATNTLAPSCSRDVRIVKPKLAEQLWTARLSW